MTQRRETQAEKAVRRRLPPSTHLPILPVWANRPIIAVSLRTDDSLLAGVPVIEAQGNGLDIITNPHGHWER